MLELELLPSDSYKFDPVGSLSLGLIFLNRLFLEQF
jgi:hypothetical protein